MCDTKVGLFTTLITRVYLLLNLLHVDVLMDGRTFSKHFFFSRSFTLFFFLKTIVCPGIDPSIFSSLLFLPFFLSQASSSSCKLAFARFSAVFADSQFEFFLAKHVAAAVDV